MRIQKIQPGETYNFNIIIGDQHSDFSEYAGPKSEYIKHRVANDKGLTLLTDGDTITMFQVLKKEEKTEHELIENARVAAHTIHKTLRDLDASSVSLVNNGVSSKQMLACLEGLWLTNYSFEKYFTKHDVPPFTLETTAVSCDKVTETDLVHLTIALEGTFFTRDLVNEPLSYLTATKLAEEMQEKSKEAGYTIEVFNKKKIESL